MAPASCSYHGAGQRGWLRAGTVSTELCERGRLPQAALGCRHPWSPRAPRTDLTRGNPRWSAAQEGPVALSAAICSPGAASPLLGWRNRGTCVGLSPACSPPGEASEASEVFCARNTIRFLLWESRLEHLTLFLFLFLAPASLCAFRGSKPQPSSSPHVCGHRLIAHPAAAGCPHTGAPLPIITINDVCTLWQVSEGAAPESAIWNTLLDDGEAACLHVHCCCVQSSTRTPCPAEKCWLSPPRLSESPK